MKVTTILCSTAFAVLGITACESDATDVRLPEFKPKLVVAAFLSPSDTISYFYINPSSRLYGDLTKIDTIGKFSAFISDGSDEVGIDISGRGYSLDHRKMKIEYGKHYSIRVISLSGLFAEATCKVPEKRSFNISLDTFRVQVNPDFMPLRFNVSFDDIAGEENYYRIGVTTISYFNYQNSDFGPGFRSLPTEKKFISDEKMDGSRIVIPSGYYLNYEAESSDSSFIIVKLFHTEKSYYLYHKSLDNYQDEGIPFMEPTLVYSNINGGLGIFTSYTVDSVVFRLK